MRIAQRAFRCRIAALCLVLAVVLSPARAVAEPSTPEIEAKRTQAAVARVDLEAMNDRLEIQIEEYNTVTDALALTQERLLEAEDELVRAELDLQEMQSRLAGRARAIYTAGDSSMLEVLLGASSFQELLVRLDFAMRIAREDARAVQDVKDARAAVEALKDSLELQEAEERALEAEAEARVVAIEADVASQEAYVSALGAEIRELIAAEEERLRQEAEEHARQAAASAASGGTSTREPADPSDLGTGHPEAATVALQYLGVPYQWGGADPLGFDCSGLCKYSYAQIGISLPHSSAAQFRLGQHIDRLRTDLLVPGDLVFFGTDGNDTMVHHVGMYIGNDQFVHAPYTGAVVRVESLSARIAMRGDYVGASRF